MAIPSQTIDLPLGAGVEQSSGEHLLDAPQLSAALNLDLTSRGEFRKARGAGALVSTNLPADTTGLNQVFPTGDAPILYGRRGVFSYSEEETRWTQLPVVRAAPVEVTPGLSLSSGEDSFYYEVAVGDDVIVETWKAGDSLWYRVRDKTTLGVVLPATPLVASAAASDSAKVVHFFDGVNTTFVVFYLVGTDLYSTYFVEHTTTDYAFAAPTLFKAGVYQFDICKTPGVGLGYLSIVAGATTGAVTAYSFDYTGTSAGTHAFTVAMDGMTSTVYHDKTSDNVYVGVVDWDASDTFVHLAYLTSALGTPVESPSKITGLISRSTTTELPNARITIGPMETGGNILVAASSSEKTAIPGSSGFAFLTRAKWQILGPSLANVSATYTIPNMHVATKAFAPSGLNSCLGMEFAFQYDAGGSSGPPTNQPSMLLMTVDSETLDLSDETTPIAAFPVVLARLYHDESVSKLNESVHVGGKGRGFLPNPTPRVGAKWFVPGLRIVGFSYPRLRHSRIRYAGHRYQTERVDAAARTVDFDPLPVTVVDHGRSNSLAGGFVNSFDGETLAENTPHFFPEVVLALKVGNNPSGIYPRPAVTTYTYSYKLVFSWKDQAGRTHKTADSMVAFGNASDAVFASGDFFTAYDLKLYFLTPPVSHLRGQDSKRLVVQVYLSVDGGNYHLFYEGSPAQETPELAYVLFDAANDPSVAEHTYNPLLSATSGTLPPYPPPAMRYLCPLGERVYGINAEKPAELWYTKLAEPDTAPEWNGNLVVTGGHGDTFVGIAGLDDKLLVFTEDKTYVVPEGGPNNLGTGAASPNLTLLSSDTGCLNPRSIAAGPFGVIFQGSRGFYVVDRGLNFHYVGNLETTLRESAAFVGGMGHSSLTSALLGRIITSAVLVPEAHEIRFTTTSETILVYHYQAQQWSLRLVGAQTAALVAEAYVMAGAGSGGWTAARERTRADTNYSYATIAGTAGVNALGVTTAWIKPASLQGFVRLRRITLLGKHTTGKLKVEIAYNYDETWTDTITWAHTDLPGDGTEFQLRLKPSRQKIESFRLRVTELAENPAAPTTFGAGFTLSGISLEVARKRGSFKHINTSLAG